MTRRRVLLVLALLLTVGGLVGWRQLHSSPLARVRAELDATDPGWQFADIRAARLRDQPPEGDNAVLVAVAAAAVLPRDFDMWHARMQWGDDLPSPTPPAEPAGNPVMLAESVALARRIEHLPRGAAGTVIPADPQRAPLPHLDDCHRVGRLLRVDAVRSAATDPARSVGDVRAILNLGRALDREPLAVSRSAATAHHLRAADALLRCLAAAELPADRLAVAHAELAAAADPARVAESVRDCRAAADLVLTAVAAGDASLSGWANGPLASRPGRVLYRLHVTDDHAFLLTELTDLLAVARRPVHEWVDAVAARPPLVNDTRHAVSYPEADYGRRLLVESVRHIARLRTAVLAVGCERFRLMHGRWPDALAELPPELLLADTTDPFTGHPLVLRRQLDGLAVYSLGPDKADDGGTFGTAPARPPRQDIGWRLWDMSARGRPQPDGG